MKRAVALTLVLLTLAGCGYTREQRAASGGLIGAGAGALMTGSLGGAVVGGAIGAVGGAATAPENNDHHHRHSDY